MKKKEKKLEKILKCFQLKQDDIIGNEFDPPFRYCVENKKYTKTELNYIKNYKKKYPKQYKKTQETSKSYWGDWNILRFIQGSNFNLEKTSKNIESHINWKNLTILNPLYLKNLEKPLKKGFLYMCGRDNRYRPIIIINTKKIIDSKKSKDKILKIFLKFFDTILNEFMVFGKIENVVVIVDFKDVGTFGLPVGVFKFIGEIFEANFRNRMFRIFVVNAPWAVSVIFFFAKSFSKNSQKKLVVSRECHPKKMGFIHEKQIEEKYGGVKDDVECFWPIQETDLVPENVFVNKEDLKSYITCVKDVRKINDEDKELDFDKEGNSDINKKENNDIN